MPPAAKPGAAKATGAPPRKGAEKPGAEEADAPPKKSKKKLIIIIAVMVLLIGSGAAAFLLMKPSPPANADEAEVAAEEEEAYPDVPPTYVQLGTFTSNLINEEGDRYLQVAIELKITKPELAEKIKATNPEIMHRINMLLQSKRPSDLASFDGKQKLSEQIKAQVEYVLGLRKTAPVITGHEAPGAEGTDAAQSAPTEADAAPTAAHADKSGIADVLFTSFIIQ